MSRSLASGGYRLVMAVESASRADQWYRVCADTQSGELSCICPKWLYPKGTTERGCKHTEVVQRLIRPTHTSQPGSIAGATQVVDIHPLVQATQQQWPGLVGQWSIEERDSRIGSDDYHFVLLRLVTNTGYTASGVAAFAKRHHPTQRSMIPSVAGWIGYAIAAEVARQAGFPLAGQPPEDYRAGQGRRTARRGSSSTSAPARVALHDILRVGDTVNLGDGLQPVQRAENTLRLFLGELYTQLERQGYLDVCSKLYANDRRVYRLRRDPEKRSDRRVRVFEHEQYTKDFCIVRAAAVPEADHFLTVFLRLISDEAGVLQVVKRHNEFPPYSDSRVRETVPAVWQPAAA